MREKERYFVAAHTQQVIWMTSDVLVARLRHSSSCNCAHHVSRQFKVETDSWQIWNLVHGFCLTVSQPLQNQWLRSRNQCNRRISHCIPWRRCHCTWDLRQFIRALQQGDRLPQWKLTGHIVLASWVTDGVQGETEGAIVYGTGAAEAGQPGTSSNNDWLLMQLSEITNQGRWWWKRSHY